MSAKIILFVESCAIYRKLKKALDKYKIGVYTPIARNKNR